MKAGYFFCQSVHNLNRRLIEFFCTNRVRSQIKTRILNYDVIDRTHLFMCVTVGNKTGYYRYLCLYFGWNTPVGFKTGCWLNKIRVLYQEVLIDNTRNKVSGQNSVFLK